MGPLPASPARRRNDPLSTHRRSAPAIALSTRQEAFCRHYAVSGNAAGAARQAGYAERSARQTGCALLERPYIIERLRRIRLSWKRTERDEAGILLARLEQAWDAAVVAGSAYLMLRVLRFQAEIVGLAGSGGGNRARLWPVAHEDELGEIEAGEAREAGTEPGPLAEAVEERTRLPVSFAAPAPANDLPPADDPPEETCEYCPWDSGDREGADRDRKDDDRADGAEHDWLHQRRHGYGDIYDPWAPEEVAERRRTRLEREAEDRCAREDRTGPAKRKKKKKKTGRTGTGSTAWISPPAMTEHDNS